MSSKKIVEQWVAKYGNNPEVDKIVNERVKYMANNKSMTAVEWLAEEYNYITWLRNRDEISPETADRLKQDYLEQAKQMEKEQIIDAYDKNKMGRVDYGEQYYNETYKQ